MKTVKMMVIMTVMMVMASLIWTGCESAGGTGGVGVSPAAVTLGVGSSNTTSAVVFAAQVTGALALPLAWRVSNSSLGNIVSASGSNATYQANAGKKGDNVVTVTDQYGNEGSAVVTQE